MRAAGCTVNDMWDHRLDRQVERSRYRPLAAGVLNLDQAAAFLVAQCGISGLVLLQLNPFTQLLGVSSFLLAVAYPLSKRVTDWVRPLAFCACEGCFTALCICWQNRRTGCLAPCMHACMSSNAVRCNAVCMHASVAASFVA